MFNTFGSESAFYEVAATLIPLFLLGGVVFERLRPLPDDSAERAKWMGAAIPLIGLWVIYSEVRAIEALVSGNSTLVTRLVVASALSAGMFAVLLALWTPWLRHYKKKRAGVSLTGHVLSWYWGFGFAVVFALCVWGMEAAVSTQGTEEASNATIEELNRVDNEIFAAEERIESLAVERDRTFREFAFSMKPGIDCLAARAFLVEEDDVARLLRREGDLLEALVIEAGTLQRKLNGRPSTYRSPFPPIPKFKPRADLIPLKRCLDQEVSE